MNNMSDHIGYIKLFYQRDLKETEHFNTKMQRKDIVHNWKQLYGLNNNRGFYMEVWYQVLANPSLSELKLIRKLNEMDETIFT